MNKTKQVYVSLLYTLFISIILILSSCGLKQEQKPSIYIIAVDGLSVTDVICSDETKSLTHSGIAIMCQESVRFSHMYTTSILSAPAMASILTGLYPFDHSLHNNSDTWLSPMHETAAELAYQKKYATFFISGSASITRKSGLNQGFDYFDDLFINSSLNMTTSPILKPFEQSITQFKTWYKENQQHQFAVFYVPDLLFSSELIKPAVEAERSLTLVSQIENFDYQFYNFIEFLKKNNRWDSSYVFLVGLNGQNKIHMQIPKWTNLYSEMAQVSLLIKPQQKKRDLGINWTVDDTLSVADIGQTLFEIIGKKAISSSNEYLPTESLLPFLNNKENDTIEKIVYTETAWLLEPNTLPHTIALRDDKYFLLHNNNSKLYNSLIDRFETIPLATEEKNQIEFYKNSIKTIDKLSMVKPINKVTKTIFDYDLSHWNKKEGLSLLISNDDIKFLTQKELNWLTIESLLNSNWDFLKKISTKTEDKDLKFLILQNFNLSLKDHEITEPCLALAFNQVFSGPLLKNCEDPTSVAFFDWMSLETKNEPQKKEVAKKKFLKLFDTQLNEIKILKSYYQIGLIWDINDHIKNQPSPIFKILQLKKYKNYKIL